MTEEPADGVRVELGDDHVATVEFRRGDRNYFSAALLADIAQAIETLQDETDCRAVVLCSAGPHFCAGAALQSGPPAVDELYGQAYRLFSLRLPIVGAIQGAAVGGGLGVSLVPDFRVGSPETRFSANFAKIGLHHGFGITVTLPAVVGQQRAMEMLLLAEWVNGERAVEFGLLDRLVPADEIRSKAHEMAAEIARGAPLAVGSIRQTMRGDLAERIRAATGNESKRQIELFDTEDFAEGPRAIAERRAPVFHGR